MLHGSTRVRTFAFVQRTRGERGWKFSKTPKSAAVHTDDFPGPWSWGLLSAHCEESPSVPSRPDSFNSTRNPDEKSHMQMVDMSCPTGKPFPKEASVTCGLWVSMQDKEASAWAIALAHRPLSLLHCAKHISMVLTCLEPEAGEAHRSLSITFSYIRGIFFKQKA